MKRLILSTAFLFTTLSGCQGGRVAELEGELEDARDQAATLQEQLSQVRSDVDDLSSANSDLETAVSRFGSEDWADVVPDVQSAAGDVASATSELESSAAEQ